jgi:hypothetical protein
MRVSENDLPRTSSKDARRRADTMPMELGPLVTLIGVLGHAFELAASILVPCARVRKGYKWRGSVSGSDSD